MEYIFSFPKFLTDFEKEGHFNLTIFLPEYVSLLVRLRIDFNDSFSWKVCCMLHLVFNEIFYIKECKVSNHFPNSNEI